MNGWFFCSIVALQILLVIVMYRWEFSLLQERHPSNHPRCSISISRAKDIFLTTYYDPFYPDLHLYTVKPDTHHDSTSFSASRTPWTFLSMLDTIQREGWRIAAAEIWGKLVVVVSGWQRQAWEAWGADDPVQSMSWPPT
jgi:hypothetical protein